MEQVETKVDVLASRIVGRNEASTDTSEQPVDVLAAHYLPHAQRIVSVARNFMSMARAFEKAKNEQGASRCRSEAARRMKWLRHRKAACARLARWQAIAATARVGGGK